MDNILTKKTFDPNNLAHLSKIIGQDMVQQVTQQFIESIPQYLIDIQEILTANDIKRLRHKIHQFKGESLQLGAMQLSCLCEQIENSIKQEKLKQIPIYLDKMEAEFIQLKMVLNKYDEQFNTQ
ncbi:MAG: Hpt domain-containing protein [Thiomargarita sp.]|nr:Hpt domain-containing protein [Thiomargarita sp.]